MTQRTTPTTSIEESAHKSITNFDRLLVILERNAANSREPELVARLREMLARLRAATDEHNGRA
jgi:hypothetical protein